MGMRSKAEQKGEEKEKEGPLDQSSPIWHKKLLKVIQKETKKEAISQQFPRTPHYPEKSQTDRGGPERPPDPF